MTETAARAHYDHLLIGAGMASHAAAAAIHEKDSGASIGILGDEPSPPVARPDLSKKLWLDDDASVDDVDLGTASETGADVLTSHRVVAVDVDAHEVRVRDEAGEESTVGYGRLLVASGGHPRRLEGLEPGERVVYYRTLDDYRRLRAVTEGGARVAVVGGGYIGTEVAAALVQNGCTVTLVHPGDVLGGHLFPATIARRVEQAFTDAGVEVRGGTKVTGGEATADGVTLHLDGGGTLEADAVVVGLGIEPATDFLPEQVRTADDGGVLVDEHLATSAPDVWAAGDVAHYPDAVLGERRVEHVDQADSMGAAAGRILAGSDEVYDHTPMFYSDLFDHWYEAIGELSTELTTVEDAPGGDDDAALVVYYLDPEKDGEVVGVLLWDCDGGLDAARDLLARHEKPSDPASLKGSVRP